MASMFHRVLALIAVASFVALSGAASAQQQAPLSSPILIVESDRLFNDSAFGQRVARSIQQAQSDLLAENKAIQEELSEEEERLTALRKDMDPTDFRELAEAFDARVEEIRAQQDAKARAILEMREREQAAFVQAARPVLAELMQLAGASMILERRSVLVSSDVIDVTDRAISRLNQTIGEGIGEKQDE